MNDSIQSDKGEDLPKPATMGELAVDLLPHFFQKQENLNALHDKALMPLIYEGYTYVAFAQYEVFDNLPEQQRTYINALCDFKYYAERSGGGLYVTSAAGDIYTGLLSGRLSSLFTLAELKRFIVLNDITFRDDWKIRLELLESAGIETDAAAITPAAGAGAPVEPAPSSRGKINRDTSGFYSIRGLAQRNNIPDYNYERFEKAVRRWHTANAESSAVQEITERNMNQAKWIFNEHVVMHIIRKYQEKD